MRRLILLPFLPLLLMGASVSQNLSIPITQSDQTGGCPMGSAYPDGCANAPAGTPQYPNLLTSYGSHRPPWNVPGVDYYVGAPTGITLTDWRTLSNPAYKVNADGSITFNSGCGGKNIVFDKIDFTLGGTFRYMYDGNAGCTSISITNSRFGCPNNSNGNNMLDLRDANLTIILKNDTFDWLGCESQFAGGGSGGNAGHLLFAGATGNSSGQNQNITVQYIMVRRNGTHPFGFNGVASLNFNYNLLYDVAYDFKTGAHMNCTEWFGTQNNNVNWSYNTCWADITIQQNATGGQGPQFYSNNNGNFNNTTLANNVLGQYMSNIVSGPLRANGQTNTGVQINQNNYFDCTNSCGGAGQAGVYYPGTMGTSTGWTVSGNIYMANGQTCVPGTNC